MKTISAAPPCRKICSYDFDAKEGGRYYPLLYKDVNCPNTLYRMAHSPYPVIRPPPRRPPPHLLTNFTINGHCPLTFRYFNDAVRGKRAIRRFGAAMFHNLLKWDRVSNINGYRDNALKHALAKYKHLIYEKTYGRYRYTKTLG